MTCERRAFLAVGIFKKFSPLYGFTWKSPLKENASKILLFCLDACFYVGAKASTHYMILSYQDRDPGLKRQVVKQVLAFPQVFSFKVNHLDAKNDQVGMK